MGDIHHSPDTQASNFKLAVALGLVPGWQIFRKFGMCDSVGSGTYHIWPPGTPRILPTAASVASLVSDSAADTAAGIGARTVRIEGLDADFLPIWEIVTTNGLTPVTTTLVFFRINRAYAVTAGTNETNVGNLSISISGGLQAYVEAGEGQTHQTNYTVPAGYTVIVTDFTLSTGRIGNADIAILSQVRPYGSDYAWRTISDVQPYQNQYANSSSVNVLPEKMEVRQEIVSTATNAEVSGVWGGYIVDNDFISNALR